MIRITVYKNKRNSEIGFDTEGHSGYDEEGKDIICSAVSILEQNLANSVSELTDAEFRCEKDDEKGKFSFRLDNTENREARVLLRSCILGFRWIMETYGEHYLMIKDQEAEK